MTLTEFADLARTYVAAMALILIALFVRLAWQRVVRYGLKPGVNPNPLASLGIAILLADLVADRNRLLGDEPTAMLWVSVAGVTLTMAGMMLAVSWRRPEWWPRRNQPEDD